ncbi:4-hydroxy-tetrahydrodipicolinate synthase [Streptomyces sp. NBC_01210]|uniref:4-hydroxy-tetrahydrodipicolinate synthase n=1 Tax=Streptomyces sp. NBC_01210 TaxID=2903774 RepID=UPI002E0FB03E|nr:4-hydroxy-tetrahydrodipicolinate synthase [Streptomyces sp. NBC_01210]
MRVQRPFGRVVVAMVSPFTRDGALDLDGAGRLATHLVDRHGVDGIVVNGTTGESSTMRGAEKRHLLRAVVEAVGDRAIVTAGVGSSDTTHTVRSAQKAERAGAQGLLVVTPYFSRPPQTALVRHLSTVADACGLPVMLYDIPARTGVELRRDTLLQLAEHPRIVAVKDCAYNLGKSAAVIASTPLRYYSGADELNLPLAAVGAVGCVSAVGNVAGHAVRAVLDAYESGRPAKAAELHQRLLPLIEAMMGGESPGAVTAKALLNHQGLPGGTVRAPLQDAAHDLTAQLIAALEQASSLWAADDVSAGSPS